MTFNMANKGKGDQSHSTTSLLLQPPRSVFSWTEMNSSAILMPVSQSVQSTLEGPCEVDSFIGQPKAEEKSKNSPLQPVSQSLGPVQQNTVDAGPLTQLQQPLRLWQPKPSSSQSSSPATVDSQHSPSSASTTQHSTFSSPLPPLDIGSTITEIASLPSQHSSVTQSIMSTSGFSQSFPYQDPPGYTSTIETDNIPLSTPSSVIPPTSQSVPLFSPHTEYHEAASYPNSCSTSNATIPGSSSYQSPSQTDLENVYIPIEPHWFYCKVVETKEVWYPFSLLDSANLEAAYKKNPSAVIATDGGRYDVYLAERLKKAVYWEEDPLLVRRCTWFYKPEGQHKFVPYDEDLSKILEEHYQVTVFNNRWHQKVELSGSESIVIHTPKVILHFLPSDQPDEWGNVPEGHTKPRRAKRGIGDIIDIKDGEAARVDNLVFVVHGIGTFCDLRFRSVVECVDDMRDIAFHLMKTHFKHAVDQKKVGRVEFLPISWHASLHEGSFGMDRRIQNITLPSIPKLRHFANDTVLDILFYTSPVYCQCIVDIVGSELNKLYQLFISRNPNFSGQVSVAGHSLGSQILFDILAHQPSSVNYSETKFDHEDMVQSSPSHTISSDVNVENSDNKSLEEDLVIIHDNGTIQDKELCDKETNLESVFKRLGLEEFSTKFQEERLDLETLTMCSEQDFKEMGLPLGPRKKLYTYLQEHKKEKEVFLAQDNVTHKTPLASKSLSVHSISYTIGMDGTGQPSVTYPKLNFPLATFFALGSPIAVFLTVRGIETISESYHFPTCPGFFNIFHPFDPVAYRVETLIEPTFNLKPVLIPHHKGRKRMHLQLKENLTRMGSDLKQKLMDSLSYTWNSISEFARAHRFPTAQIEAEVEKIVQEEIKKGHDDDEVESTVSASDNNTEEDIQIGKLNAGRRIDYVLQEKPIECLNEYVFALGSHTCYWESEDTVLMILRELYSLQGIAALQQPFTTSISSNPVVLYNPAVSPPKYQNLPSVTASVTVGSHISTRSNLQPYQHMNSAPPTTAYSQGVPLSRDYNSASVPPQVSLGPPPLTGFVKVSPIAKKSPALTR